MHILVSNDDGYHSEGLRVLRECLVSTVSQVTVVAPNQDRSASSNSLTVDQPLRVRKLETDFYVVNGTPTDCVHLALTGLLNGKRPDMVISGINHGENLGDDVLYSGTVAAAMEGRFLGLPAIAVSAIAATSRCFATAGHFVANLVRELPDFQSQTKVVLNVNVPDLAVEAIAGVRASRLGSRHSAEPVRRDRDPRGQEIYWVGNVGGLLDFGPGTDFEAISNGCISITPLGMDLTNHSTVPVIRQWLKHWHINT